MQPKGILKYKVIWLFFCVFSMCWIVNIPLNAQKLLVKSDTIILTRYKNAVKQDSIYVFYGLTAMGNEIKGKVQALPRSEGLWNYKWEILNISGKNFVHLSQFTGNMADNLNDGYYRVIISNNTFSDTLGAWIWNDNMELSLSKDRTSGCTYLKINPQILFPVQFEYFDVQKKDFDNKLVIENAIRSFEWSADPKPADWPKIPLLKALIINQPPFEPTNINFQATDSLGNTKKYTIRYRPISVKADFSYQIKKQENKTGNEAPLTVGFTNKSKNATLFNWTIISKNQKDTLVFSKERDPMDHIFEIPDHYSLKLLADNEICKDSLLMEWEVKVDSSSMEVQDYIYPNSVNAESRVFKPKAKSLKEIDFKIFSRSGSLVYQFNGDYENWEGWNGNVGTSSREAAPGPYMYYIRGVGRDAVLYEKKGFVYLFR